MAGVIPPRFRDLPPPPPPPPSKKPGEAGLPPPPVAPKPGQAPPGKLPELPPLPPEFAYTPPVSPPLKGRVAEIKPEVLRTSSSDAAESVKEKLKTRLGGIFGFKAKTEKPPTQEKLFAEHKGAPKAEKETLVGIQGSFNALNECFRDYSEVRNFLIDNPGAKNLTSRDLLGTHFIEGREETHVKTVLKKPVPPALQPSAKNPLFANALGEAVKRKGSDLSMGEILEVWKTSLTDPIDGKLQTEVALFLEFAKENYPVDQKVLQQKLSRLKEDQIEFQSELKEADGNLKKASEEFEKKRAEFQKANGDLEAKRKIFDEASVKFKKGEIDSAPYEQANEDYAEALEKIDHLQSELEGAERKLLAATAAFEEIDSRFLDLANQKVRLESEFDKNGAFQIRAMETRLADIQEKISQLTLPS